jgi:hypothetical protein
MNIITLLRVASLIENLIAQVREHDKQLGNPKNLTQEDIAKAKQAIESLTEQLHRHTTDDQK